VAGFEKVIETAKGGTVVVLDAAAVPVTRAWCLYEWDHTLHIHGGDQLHMPLEAAAIARVVPLINVANAQV
jgi:hypothetical protein